MNALYLYLIIVYLYTIGLAIADWDQGLSDAISEEPWHFKILMVFVYILSPIWVPIMLGIKTIERDE